MKQTLVWPVDLQRQDDGAILVSFPDIPEALTEGATEADALTQARDCLIGAMRAQGVGNTALAARLGLTEGAVRRLIDLDHRSHIGQIETALHALGKRLMVATQAA